jgi:hypothetical protein
MRRKKFSEKLKADAEGGAVMGYLSALELRQYLSEEQALIWHLRYNHYPPINLIFLPAIREALAAARRGHYRRKLTLPSGKIVTVATVVKDAHLGAFLDDSEDA